MFRLCSKHRKDVLTIPDDVSIVPDTLYSHNTCTSEFVIDDSRELMNHILAEVNLSPIRSQTRKKLSKYSDSGLRRIAAKLNASVQVIQSMLRCNFS